MPVIGHKNILSIILAVIVFVLSLNNCNGSERPVFLTGDVIFQESKSSQSEAIKLATGSKYSHVGMIVVKGKQISVLEAVGRVKYTPLNQWIDQGDGGHYVVKRYKVKSSYLNTSNRKKLITEGEKFLDLPYDPYFLWSDDGQYCSELLHKIYMRALGIELSPLTRMRSFDLSHPVVKSKIKERFGSNPPLDELVVPPSALYNSKLLTTLYVQ